MYVFEYSMIPDQNPEFAELGLCGPREASYAPLRMLSNYQQLAGKLEFYQPPSLQLGGKLRQYK
ncbi:MAG TPA: hypothetical protein VKZ54_06075 [Membranihabitans sp.]|nr:hypothetical protein [Membranihabitans sp.]